MKPPVRLLPFAVHAALAAVLLTSCSSVERTFGGARADFRGGAAVHFEDLPQPDPERYALGELEIRINSDLLGQEERKRLVQNIGATVGGRWKPWTTRSKKPEYLLVINQINSQQEWEGSDMAATLGGASGAAVGATIDDNSPWRGGIIGGVVGAGVGYVAFGAERNAWAFHISVTQATSGMKMEIGSQESHGAASQGGVGDATSQSGSGQQSGTVRKSELSYEGREHRYVYGCEVVVEAGSFHARSSIEAAAREKLIERLPEAMLGGGSLAGW